MLFRIWLLAVGISIALEGLEGLEGRQEADVYMATESAGSYSMHYAEPGLGCR
jgi:hypothetical protein